MSITLRRQIGRPLTWDELDQNFQDVESLNSQSASNVALSKAYSDSAEGFADSAQTSANQAAASAATIDIDEINNNIEQKASKGANNDITSLSGLSTPLSVQQGGTGASDGASALSSLGLTLQYLDDLGVTTQSDLAANSGASLIGSSNGKTVQQTIDRLTVGLLADDTTLSTTSLTGKTKVLVDKDITVVDADNQGAKVNSNTTIMGTMSNQNAIKTTKKNQSALRLNGSNITLKQLRGVGAADNTSTATAEFITSRMASVVDGIPVKNIFVDDVFVTNFTTGVAISGQDGAVYTNIRGENLRFSPDGLSNAGGYLFVFGGGTSRNINISNVYHRLVPGADRHTLYISAQDTEIGWENVVCSNITCDWSANSVNNKATNGVPFAMHPVHVRTGNNLAITNYTVLGYCGGVVALENQYGPITNVTMSNVIANGCNSFQNGDLMETASIDIGFPGYSNRNQHISIDNCITKIVRGIDNSGVKMPAGSDLGVKGGNVDFVSITNSHFTMESGHAVALYNCNDVVIDNLFDTLIDTTSAKNTIYLNGCSRVTIGKVRSNRQSTSTKERVYTVTDNCSEITCSFPRRILLTVSGGILTVNDDRWDMLNGTPTLNADGRTINVPLRNHVSTNAKRLCNVHNTTLSNMKAIRVGDLDANTLRIGFWDTNLNAQATTNNVNNALVIEFTC